MKMDILTEWQLEEIGMNTNDFNYGQTVGSSFSGRKKKKPI